LRRDITEGLEGEALRLRIRLGGLSGRGECRPLVGAVIDLWQGDAHGVYSNVGENIQQRATPGATFMRGHQITDDQGMVEFDTVVPGWEVITAPPPENFTVRTTHIHVKIYHEWQVFDAQLYFPDELIDSLYAEVEPYRSNNTLALPGTSQQISRVRNVDDEQFRIVEATPMAIERVDGRLVADAVIGRAFAVNRGIPSMYGR
jgi:protocatechuate 3,4-dioxygenase beta subunit